MFARTRCSRLDRRQIIESLNRVRMENRLFFAEAATDATLTSVDVPAVDVAVSMTFPLTPPSPLPLFTVNLRWEAKSRVVFRPRESAALPFDLISPLKQRVRACTSRFIGISHVGFVFFFFSFFFPFPGIPGIPDGRDKRAVIDRRFVAATCDSLAL